MDDITEQERQMLIIIRENANRDGFALSIRWQDGACEIAMSALVSTLKSGQKLCSARGVGASFAAAWDGMNPNWA